MTYYLSLLLLVSLFIFFSGIFCRPCKGHVKHDDNVVVVDDDDDDADDDDDDECSTLCLGCTNVTVGMLRISNVLTKQWLV